MIVSWQSGTELLACVRSLAAARGLAAFAVELVVVDNASAEFPAAGVASAWPDARVIRNQTNRGFGPAANQGATVAAGDVLLFLNPDTLAVDNPLPPLLDVFANHQEAVAAAPRLLDAESGDRAPQPRFQLRRLPTLGRAARELLLLDRVFPNGRAARRAHYLDHDLDRPFPVEQPAAAALAVRRDVFRRLGGFDESFFPAWFEDVDLCARLRAEGTILYMPDSRFRHAGGLAVGVLGYQRFLPIYYRNACRYWSKHRGAAAAFGFRLLVAAGMALRLLLVPLGLRLPAPRREAALAYLGVVRVVLAPPPASAAPARWTGGAR